VPHGEVHQGYKKRDPHTGDLSGFGVEGNPDLHGKKVVIIDDICDGGGTFLGLGAEINRLGAYELKLGVTHGLFTKGMTALEDTFDVIMSMGHDVPWKKLLEEGGMV